jgi:hypothetical protein
MHLGSALGWTVGLVLVVASPAIAGGAVGAESGTAHSEFRPYEGPNPIVVLIQTIIWTGGGGALPSVVVYEDGELVVAKDRTYCHRRLQRAELDELRSRVASLAALPDLKRRYNLAPGLSDATEELLYAQSGGREIVTDVYALGHGWLPPGELPAELLGLHRFLASLAMSEGSAWRPRYVEVALSPSRSPSSRTQPWPAGWPGLGSDRVLRRGVDRYSILLDAPLEAELHRLIGKDRRPVPFRIGGRRWSVETTRPVFPSEPVWVSAFEALR